MSARDDADALVTGLIVGALTVQSHEQLLVGLALLDLADAIREARAVPLEVFVAGQVKTTQGAGQMDRTVANSIERRVRAAQPKEDPRA